MTTPAPDLPDFSAGQQPVTVPTYLGTATVAPNGSSPIFNVSAFTSIIVLSNSGGGLAGQLNFSDNVPGVGGVAVANSQPLTSEPLLIRCPAQQVTITVPSTSAGCTFWVFGYGRDLVNASGIVAGWQAASYKGSLASTVMAVGSSYFPSTQNKVAVPQGPCWMSASFSLATFKGEVFADGICGNNVPLIDSTDCVTDSGGALSVRKMVAIPPDVFEIRILSNAVQTTTATIFLCPAY
jgi:hypothetical protein